MARTASGIAVLKQAKAFVVQAKTADQLRQARAVLLPLEFGLSLEQTAQAIGVSVGCPMSTGTVCSYSLTRVAARYPHDRIVMVLDGAGWH